MNRIIDNRIFRLTKSVLDDLTHDWTVEEMADCYGVTTQHFQKLFKHEIGVPPMAWHHDQRLEKFAELLLTTYHPIKVIGFMVGLTDQTHLTRDFKKKFGLTPTDYRKHHAAIEQSQAPNGQE